MGVLTLKIPDKLARELSRAALARGVPKSRLAREAIASYLGSLVGRKRPFVSALDLAGDLAGRVRAGPHDLATNPRHMEDFGKD